MGVMEQNRLLISGTEWPTINIKNDLTRVDKKKDFHMIELHAF